ncbi:MAG: hypothetical protein H6830_03560 [Planctomycetes bacterium]|nr:hypothetical protein [Planctomycetota bacterium]
MKLLNVLLAILVSLAVFLGVFEVGLRMLGLGPPKVLNQFDAQLGWSPRPGLEIQRKSSEFSVRFRINEYGMRDDADLKPAKPAGTTRVLCLGDSFTLGYSVARKDLFVDQLEHWWNVEERDVQVINAGAEGYSTDQEVAWLMEHGKTWAPDMVLLFAYENDLYYNGQDHYLRFPKPRFDAQGNLETAPLVDPGPRPLLARTAIGNLLLKKQGLDTFTPPQANRPWPKERAPLLPQVPEFLGDALARTQGALIALDKQCQALGAKLAVVMIPSHSAVNEDFAQTYSTHALGIPRSDWDPNRPVNEFRAAAQAAGVPFLDPTETMRAAQASRGDLYFSKDFHLNPLGNQVLASFVHEKLHEAGMAPGEGTFLEAMPDVPAAAGPGVPRWLLVYLFLWAVLGSLYGATYRDENAGLEFLKVGGLLALIFTIAMGGSALLAGLPPFQAKLALVTALVALFGFIFYKMGDRLSTIVELIGAFIARGHWYLMPLVMILLSVGSLLVVAASSPLVAPFIYTLF